MNGFAYLAVLAAVLAATAAFGQAPGGDLTRRPPNPADSRSGGSGVEAQIRYLQDADKLGAAEARERYDVLQEIEALIAAARAEDADAFAGLWVEHEPVFRIVAAFAGNDERSAFAAKVSPNLRRHLQLRKVRKSLVESEAELAALFLALRVGGPNFTLAFEPTSQKYVVTAADDSGGNRLRALVPAALRDLVQIRKGPVGRDVQSGVQAGDAVYASSVSGSSSGRAYTGMVRVGRSSQSVTAFSGDSGAPVFSFPNSGYNITAHGIMKAAEAHTNSDGSLRPCVNGQGYDCGYFYMPIDRANDRVPFLVHTTAGLVVP